MPRENDLEGAQDQGGKHGGEKGMPKPEPRRTTRREPARGDAPDQGIVRDERGQEPPRDKERAQQVSRIRFNDESSDRLFPWPADTTRRTASLPKPKRQN